MADRRPITIHYGDRPGATVDHDRTGLPDDCPCPAVRWCGQPPTIRWPETDCPHHGHRAYGLHPRPSPKENPMDFRHALDAVIADLTPQPWDYTTPEGTTLRVIPAGLSADKGDAEVYVRITQPGATGLAEYGITGPDSRGVAEVGVTTTVLPGLIRALTDQRPWEDTTLVSGTLAVTPGAAGVGVRVVEDHGQGREEAVSILLPEAQRLPLASALRRAYDVARGWED